MMSEPTDKAENHATGANKNSIQDMDMEGKMTPVQPAALYSFWQACGLNTMMMFGTGPFISIPLCLAATDPAGPQAMIGYAIAAVGCSMDSLVWGELGSRWPESGGSYIYLQKLYGEETWGKLAAFLYVWQFFVSGPAEIASGFIAISEYAAYLHGSDSWWAITLPSVVLLLLSIGMLMRKVEEVGKITIFLWSITIFAIAVCIIGGFLNFDSNNLAMPPDAFNKPSTFILSLAAACRFGVYDFTGYYDVCQMGGEVQNPKKTIPHSCIVTCFAVLVVYFGVYMSVLGFLPWFGEDGFVATEDSFIMGTFAEKLVNKSFAMFFVIIVCITIFGSAFSMVCGMQFVPGAAAEDGLFFSWFAVRDESRGGIPARSLAVLGALSTCWCFFSLDVVIDAMTVMIVLVQFLGQSVGLLVYRRRMLAEEDHEAWKIPCYPLPVILQIIVFLFIFITSDNWLISGNEPLLDLCCLFLLLGVAMFLVRQKIHDDWPFAIPKARRSLRERMKSRKSNTATTRKESESPLDPSASPGNPSASPPNPSSNRGEMIDETDLLVMIGNTMPAPTSAVV
jgi:amino acid transporter